MKVMLVNHTQQGCGVYQYGNRLYETLWHSDEDKFYIIETQQSSEFFFEELSYFNPDVIIYNYNRITAAWLTPEVTSQVNAKQVYVYHDAGLPTHLKHDAFLMTDMTSNESAMQFALPRPMPDVTVVNGAPSNDMINVGSFGLAFHHKGFNDLCRLVQDQYDEAVINIHMTRSDFMDPDGSLLHSVVDSCHAAVTKPGIKLNISTQFATDQQLLDFLCKNDINVFTYHNLPGNGLSSVIDYLPKTTSPFAVNSSDMFRHINSRFPEINCDNNSLASILEQGTRVNDILKKEWSDESICATVNRMLEAL